MTKRPKGNLLFTALLAACGAGIPVASFAQNPPAAQPSSSDEQWRRDMEARMRQLEQENQDLKVQVAKVADTQQAVMKDAQDRGILTLEGGQPRLTTPDFFDVNKYVAEGDFPGSFLIPGTKVSLQIGGFVQSDVTVDNHRIGDKDQFVVNTIPTGGADTGSGDTNFSIRQTRVFLKTQAPTDNWGNLITYIEIDFFGTDGAEPRLRHAYGQFGDKFQILTGQTWSAFQDATVFPALIDGEGPAGIITNRRPQVRVREQWNDQWSSVLSLEDGKSDITTPAGFAGQNATPIPDLDGNVRWQPDWGHLQLSGVLRYLQFDPDVGSRQSEVGYGLNLTGSFKAFKFDDKHQDIVLWQLAGGNGISRYVNDTGGLGLDAVLPAAGSDLDGLSSFEGVLAYQHWWTAKLGSTFCYSYVQVDNDSAQADSTYHKGQYVAANLRYYPVDRVLLGVEVLYGIREDKNGDDGDDVRLQFSAQYRF